MAKNRLKKTRSMEKMVDKIANEELAGKVINIMAILEIHKSGVEAAIAGNDVRLAVRAAIEKASDLVGQPR